MDYYNPCCLSVESAPPKSTSWESNKIQIIFGDRQAESYGYCIGSTVRALRVDVSSASDSRSYFALQCSSQYNERLVLAWLSKTDSLMIYGNQYLFTRVKAVESISPDASFTRKSAF